ncbi:Flagellar biosynthesis protein FliR [Labilithrix luteola]|uniref:Flagellar biosynthesis protein FliR n=1 Tax=Labilithrix luteola TaxID=1391654 RepID=A0A0K1PLB2_9BACT|nr:flagellar biosynthetic protein FliR [Labilithrix luteola]AKU94191.1 Flagellar biosynthesis protein FliR [Labilithrix luteola]
MALPGLPPPFDDGLHLDTGQLEAVGLAWARVFPTVSLVPAFGLKALPTPARGILALAIAAGIYPSLVPIVMTERHLPWVVLALEQILLGLPVALAASIPLWAATMAGGVVDSLRGANDGQGLAVVEGRAAGFGILLSLFGSVVFLATGGPARAASALAQTELPAHPLLAASHDLVAGIGLAVAIGGPVLAAAVVLEVAFALIARSASPAQVHALFAPVRALGLLAVVAVVLERLAALVATAVRNAI